VGFKDIELKKVYDTRNNNDDPVTNFYVPALCETVVYDRGTGYFSSTVLSLAARGIAGLIRNGGRMRILTSPELTAEDSNKLKDFYSEEDAASFVENKLSVAMHDFDQVTNLLVRDHLGALAWMLSEGMLEIRITIPRDPESIGGMLHFKLGVMTDKNGDRISFSGSNNESVGGWVRNIEQIKVFKSWEIGQDDYLRQDQMLFDRYWNSSETLDTLTISLPEAIKAKLIRFAPSDVNELNEILKRIDWPTDLDLSRRRLREYQENALDAWRAKNFRGVLEMATGTGKTLTASKCIDEILGRNGTSMVLVVVPLIFLASQWAKELQHLNPMMVNGGTDWRSNLRSARSDLRLGLRDHVVMIAVQNTASTNEFVELSEKLLATVDNTLIVVDEVHGVGAEQFSNLMVESYKCRLGLSATPNRWFDDDGTERIMDYFGGVIYTFGIHEALNWIDPLTGLTPLCPYNYYPSFVELTDEESEKYSELSDQIKKAAGSGESVRDNRYLKNLVMRRALITKKAKNKIEELRRILDVPEDNSGTLVYCSDGEQLEEAAEVLNDFGITYRRFSGEEGAYPRKEYGNRSERDLIMQDFESGAVDVLLAMKCLDEGVDIPSAKRGVILASSTNPREFIQRRGRLLRRAPGKVRSDIFDVLVLPMNSARGDSAEMNMLTRELKRVEEFAQDALNEIEIRKTIMEKSWTILQ
jgi:superfamily II DNA or RNA helicase